MKDESLYSTQAAGEWLHEALPGESPAHWSTALTNNRRGDRTPAHRVPFVTIGRGAFYTVEDLQEFVRFERGRRVGSLTLSSKAMEALRAVGFNEKGGSSTGRHFDVTRISRQIDEATGEPFVQLILNNPHLLVYRLPLAQARELADQLYEEAGGKPGQSTYETLIDNDSVLIKRKGP